MLIYLNTKETEHYNGTSGTLELASEQFVKANDWQTVELAKAGAGEANELMAEQLNWQHLCWQWSIWVGSGELEWWWMMKQLSCWGSWLANCKALELATEQSSWQWSNSVSKSRKQFSWQQTNWASSDWDGDKAIELAVEQLGWLQNNGYLVQQWICWTNWVNKLNMMLE